MRRAGHEQVLGERVDPNAQALLHVDRFWLCREEPVRGFIMAKMAAMTTIVTAAAITISRS